MGGSEAFFAGGVRKYDFLKHSKSSWLEGGIERVDSRSGQDETDQLDDARQARP